LTIVAFGTSAPELVVNLTGAIRNETALAFGNVIGSNLANLGLVLALAAVVRPVQIQGRFVLRELPLLLLGTAMIVVMSIDPLLRGATPTLDRSDGAAILLLFCIFIYISVLDVFRPGAAGVFLSELEANPVVTTAQHGVYPVLFVAAGVTGLFWGGQLTVDYGVALAADLGVSAAIVGLFVVAVGTSLPELVTTIIAAARRQSDLALGNVVGSNIFNCMFILPLTAVVRPLGIPTGGLLDLAAGLLLAALIVYLFLMGNHRLGRATGAMMLAAYLAYGVFRVAA